MKIAIMQPYFFPYLGYYKLISKVDKFVFLDDVQYTRKGWINRNMINMCNPLRITLPIKKCSQKTKINKIEICGDWIEKHLKTFMHIYGKKILSTEFYNYYITLKDCTLLSDALCKSVIWTTKFLKINDNFSYASLHPSKKNGKERIIELCKIYHASEYVNLPNGKLLYDCKYFEKNNIKLSFVDTSIIPKISIIDFFLSYHTNEINLYLT